MMGLLVVNREIVPFRPRRFPYVYLAFMAYTGKGTCLSVNLNTEFGKAMPGQWRNMAGSIKRI